MSTESPGSPGSSGPPARRRLASRLPGGGLPGATVPMLRLAVNANAFRQRLSRPGRAFPVAAPPWPDSVPRPVEPSELGVAYDTDWARRYPARFARLLMTEGITSPTIRLLADPFVEGVDRIRHLDGPVIFAANHASHLDLPLLLSVLPEPWRHKAVVAAAADYFFDTRVKAVSFALAINAVPLERTRVSRASANQATRLLDAGWSLIIFPEGGRSPDGWAQPHRPGAAWLGVRTGRPIVPVHIEGTGRILPRGSTRIRPGSTRVAFGRPITTDGPDVDARALADQLERAVTALADEGASDWWTATKRAAARTSPSLTGPAGASAWRRTWALGDRRGQRRSDTKRWPKV